MMNKQYNRAIPAQQPQVNAGQLLSSTQNIFISDNTSLIQNTPQLGEAFYFHQQPQLNINTMNQIHAPHYTNSHSLLSSMGSMQQNSLNNGSSTIYDPHLTRVYSTTNGAPSESSSSASLIENSIKSSVTSQQSNAILIDNFTSQLQEDQAKQVYRSSAQISQQFPSTPQLQHSTMARQQTQRAPELNQHSHNYESKNVAATTNSAQIMQLHNLPATNQSIFLSADTFGTTSTGKMSAYLPFKVNSSFPTSINDMYQRQLQTSTSASVLPSNAVANNTSPVVLDRINICINNHYTEPNFSSPIVDTSPSCVNSVVDNPSLSSPIIPPIQHTAVIDPALLREPSSNSTGSTIALVSSVVNEPDSTTTSHTPPSTPDNINKLIADVNAIQSPSTSSTAKVDEPFKYYGSSTVKIIDSAVPGEENKHPVTLSDQCNENPIEIDETIDIAQDILTIPDTDHFPESIFTIGDDVFVKIDNDRLYLGTIIDTKYQKFRVRFDDASEMWCSPKEMRKFGVCDLSNASSGTIEKAQDDSDLGALCVACKKRDLTDVDICERCGRGYHKTCTTETAPGSGEWNCKRCAKSMKVDSSEYSCDEYENCPPTLEKRRHLPYDLERLHWDSKHRVNEEQIYCYCGRSGQFDSMLQCCKCRNWYHTGCIQNFKNPMLRGDWFFIFCCAVCSCSGNEFLRRLEMDNVNFMHLVLYNLSAKKKHQHHKYHHLTKDICPFVLAQRQTSALPEKWLDLNEDELKDCILATLKDNSERFVCGRELKRDYYFYGLRNNGPPPPVQLPKICKTTEINDEFIVENLKLKLSKRATENATWTPVLIAIDSNSDKSDTDGKFTSDDELPIKMILEKEKVKNKETIIINDSENDILTENRQQSETKPIKKIEIKNHKRKAFTLSRPYKDPAGIDNKERNANTPNCESSSDENSSSSRGTSLDLIIPPPKNFLGANNPFRTVATPKRNAIDKQTLSFGRIILGGPTIRNSVVNASALDLSSNLAALKNAGVLPNLNTTTFSRAVGQPRMVRTIKRRLSAKDIMIGPNQEIRRRRTRRLSSNVEVISTTTINPISSFFSINSSNSIKMGSTNLRKQSFSTTPSLMIPKLQPAATNAEVQNETANKPVAKHGRRLRLRPQNYLPTNSRRSSSSGASTSSTASSSGNATPQTAQYTESATLSDLQQTVNRYFGVGHLIKTGEQFSIHAKRQLPNGQTQLLIEWGVSDENSEKADSTLGTEALEKTISQENS